MSSFDGPRVPAYLKRRLRQGTLAGVILFRGNVTTAAGLRALTRTIQRAARGRALVMVDQEGGMRAPDPVRRARSRSGRVRHPGARSAGRRAGRRVTSARSG